MKVFYLILDLRSRALHVGNRLFFEHFIKGLPIYSPCFLIITCVTQIASEVVQRRIILLDIFLNFPSNLPIFIEMMVLAVMLFDHFDKKIYCIIVLSALLLLFKDKLGTFLHGKRFLSDRVILF